MSDKYVQEQRWPGELENELAVQKRIAERTHTGFRVTGLLERKLSKAQLFVVAVLAFVMISGALIRVYRDIMFGPDGGWGYIAVGAPIAGFVAFVIMHARNRSSSLDESFRLAEELEKQKRAKLGSAE